MAGPRNLKLLTAANRLLAGDATRALIAAPGTGYRLIIVIINFQIITSAAQAVDVGVNAGGVTKQVLSLPASATGVGGANLGEGFALDENAALTAVPAAAGPAIQFEVVYYKEKL
jgi:hypothetical protein